jgi:hypothetical protein
MASTYSNLKIQLMTTGENSTTWGDVTNVNLGTALEEAIVGSSDVTFSSANVTLTLSNTNASQAARNMRLRCTGTTGGSTRNLVVPSIEKPYIVANDCADSILVKTSAGNGITVPAGKTMWVYSNGTDVVDVTTHLTSLTLATALPILSGGTGSNTASGARTNLGLGTIATQNSNAVTITGGSITGITDLAIADGGTGASTAADARTNLGLGSLAVLSSINNTNWSGTALAVANGGTGATDAPTARSNLGAGTVTSVATTGTVNGITLTGTVTSSGTLTLGGTLSGVSLTSQVSGTLPIANGGTNATTAGGARTSLGSTTLGDNLFTITNPSAVTFPRFNADNTVSALDAATFRSAIGAGTSSTTGTVTSVAGTGTVNGITLTGTVTSSGSLTLGGTLTGINLTSQITGTLPIANGGTGSTSTTYCSLTTNVTGTLPVGNGGTGATTLTGILKGNGTSAFSAATAGTDYVAPGGALGTPSSGTLTNCTFPTLNQNTTGSAASLASTNFTIVQSGTDLIFKYNGTNIAKLSSTGAFTAINNVTAYGSV